MMNIQFMTEEQSKMIKGITGREEKVYLPDWAALAANASCEEEYEAIIECAENEKRYIEEGKEFLAGFAFPVIYTIKTDVDELVRDEETGRYKQIRVNKWTVYQHPWYRTGSSIDTRVSKEEVIKAIEKMLAA